MGNADGLHKVKRDVYLLVGSHFDKEINFPAGISLIASYYEVVAVSPIYETQAVGMPQAGTFYNGAMHLKVDMAPEPFKQLLMDEVEKPLGRVRQPDGVNRPPTFDVDIGLWGDLVGSIAGRPVPHPDILRHLYAARPLADIAPDLAHPQTSQTIQEIAQNMEPGGPLLRPVPGVILNWK